MEMYEGLITRRSIRKYTGDKIEPIVIEKIINAGMHAPSARNTRPWHFIVIDDKEIFSKIMEFHPYSSMLSAASHAVVVCGDDKLQNGPGYFVLDCSAAAQNILLASHALGLGAVWVGIHPKKERIDTLKTILSLPAYVHPVALISIGVPAIAPQADPHRYEPEKIRWNHW